MVRRQIELPPHLLLAGFDPLDVPAIAHQVEAGNRHLAGRLDDGGGTAAGTDLGAHGLPGNGEFEQHPDVRGGKDAAVPEGFEDRFAGQLAGPDAHDALAMQVAILRRRCLMHVQVVPRTAIVDIAPAGKPEAAAAAERVNHMLPGLLAAVGPDRAEVAGGGGAFAVAPDRIDFDQALDLRIVSQRPVHAHFGIRGMMRDQQRAVFPGEFVKLRQLALNGVGASQARPVITRIIDVAVPPFAAGPLQT